MAKEQIRSKTSRGKLAPRRDPYFEQLSAGLSIGFRKSETGGSWIGRRKNDDRKYQFKSFGDDLEFDEARKCVEKWHEEMSSGVQHDKNTSTVADVCRLYVENRRVEKGEKTAYDAQKRFERLVYGKSVGTILFTKLRPIDVERWRNAQLDADDPEDEESYNRAKDTVNRELKSLKAALNYGKDRLKLVLSDVGWKEVNQFPDVGARRKGWLTVEQRNRLLDTMPDDLRTLATALLLTGARPGEIASANIPAFNPEAGVLALNGKTGRREVPLSDTARDFFSAQAKDKIGNAPLLATADRQRWTAPVWGRAFRDVREKAGLPDAVLYCMRHTYISEAIAQGIDVYTVAELTGTSVEIIQSNYGTLTDNIVERLNRISVL